jgi:hypothetical protein
MPEVMVEPGAAQALIREAVEEARDAEVSVEIP